MTLSELTPDTASEYCLIPSPIFLNFEPSVPLSTFSILVIFFNKSEIALIAVAEEVIFSGSISETLSAYFLTASPNDPNLDEKSPKSLVPPKACNKPPVLGNDFINSIIIFIALVEFSTSSDAISVDFSLNFSNELPSISNCSPKFLKLCLPPTHDVSDCIKLVPVNNNIDFESSLTLENIDPLIFPILFINGSKFFINAERFVPITGKDDVTPADIPPAIPPINLPIAVPIVSNNTPPSPISHFNPGI